MNTKDKTETNCKQAAAQSEDYWWKLKLNSRRNKKFRHGNSRRAKYSRPPIILRI
jgi:hypothetical protein